jgi:glutathione S-transferase
LQTRDLRAQWALEETGLPYRVHGLDHTGGELDGEAMAGSALRQVPVIDDDGFVVAESAAILLHLAEKAAS